MNLPVPASSGSQLVRSAMSPVAVGGAAVGVVLALLSSGGLVALVVGLLLGWLAGTGGGYVLGRRDGRVLPRERIDPFAVGEPWRFFVRDALTARNRFDATLRSTKPGPLRDRLATIRVSIDEGVHECWEVAKQAQQVSQARKALDAPALRRRLEGLDRLDGDHSATETSLRAQLESVDRLDTVLSDVTTKLEVLEAQLTEAVTRAIEIAALAGTDDDLTGVGTDIDSVVDSLEALRLALHETSSTARPQLPPTEL